MLDDKPAGVAEACGLIAPRLFAGAADLAADDVVSAATVEAGRAPIKPMERSAFLSFMPDAFLMLRPLHQVAGPLT